MPRISSSITRKQTDAAAIPKLPSNLRDMDGDELIAFLATQRTDRMMATEKRRDARSKGKEKKAADLAAKAATEAGDAAVASAADEIKDFEL